MILLVLITLFTRLPGLIAEYSKEIQQNLYSIEITDKLKSNVIVRECVFGTIATFNVNYKMHMKYYGNMVDMRHINLCTSGPGGVGTEAVAIIDDDGLCTSINKITNLRKVKDVKITIILTDSWRMPTKSINVTGEPLIIWLNRKLVLENFTKDNIKAYKLGLYRDHSIESYLPQILSCFFVSLIGVSCVTLMCFIVVIIHKDVTNLIVETNLTVKIIAYVISMFIAQCGIIMWKYQHRVYAMILYSTFCISGAHSFAFIVRHLLDHVKYCRNINLTIHGFNQFDMKWIVFLLAGLSLPIIAIFNDGNTFGKVINIIVGIFICIEVSILLSILFAADRKHKFLMAFYILIIVPYILIVCLVPNINLYIKRSTLNPYHFPLIFQVYVNDISELLGIHCPLFYGHQAVLLHYIDLFLPGSLMVYILTFVIDRHLPYRYYISMFIGGYMAGLLVHMLMLCRTGSLGPAVLIVFFSSLAPVVIKLLVCKQLRSLFSNQWVYALEKYPITSAQGHVLMSLSHLPSDGDQG